MLQMMKDYCVRVESCNLIYQRMHVIQMCSLTFSYLKHIYLLLQHVCSYKTNHTTDVRHMCTECLYSLFCLISWQ
jgi:hypothetical protein